LEALKTYAQVFPSIKFCPTGGITEETHSSYLELPNVICVGGSWMMKK
jgi:2-dehydro-3-deoxyphosphogluconate aldolase/(4S)-4-hydroxy-2-oxoglutarate aldolase